MGRSRSGSLRGALEECPIGAPTTRAVPRTSRRELRHAFVVALAACVVGRPSSESARSEGGRSSACGPRPVRTVRGARAPGHVMVGVGCAPRPPMAAAGPVHCQAVQGARRARVSECVRGRARARNWPTRNSGHAPRGRGLGPAPHAGGHDGVVGACRGTNAVRGVQRARRWGPCTLAARRRSPARPDPKRPEPEPTARPFGWTQDAPQRLTAKNGPKVDTTDRPREPQTDR